MRITEKSLRPWSRYLGAKTPGHSGEGRNPVPLKAGSLDPGLRRGDDFGVEYAKIVGLAAFVPAPNTSPYLCNRTLRKPMRQVAVRDMQGLMVMNRSAMETDPHS